jgi:hypothetical protein
VEVYYRFRDSDAVVLSNQPVRSISSAIGTGSGTLVENIHYTFNSLDDIILEGNSTKAERSISFVYNPSDGLPAGEINEYVENIVLPGEENKYFSNKGIALDSIIVQTTDRTVTYTRNIDYVIVFTDVLSDVLIRRIDSGSISDGQTVLVDYNYGEIITVRYLVNNLVSRVQESIDTKRHVTADVLVKEAMQTDVDLEVNVKLRLRYDSAAARNAILTAISDEINNKKMGEDLYRSDIIRAIDSVPAVDYVILPMTSMKKSDGTQIVREIIDMNAYVWAFVTGTVRTWVSSVQVLDENSASDGTSTVTPLYSPIVHVDRVYNVTTGETYTVAGHTTTTITVSGSVLPLSTDTLEVDYNFRTSVLKHATAGNSGNTTQNFGVFESDEELTLVDLEASVDLATSRAMIASDGAVLLSPKNVSDPNTAVVTVSYIISGETGDNDIEISDIEYLGTGAINVLIVS